MNRLSLGGGDDRLIYRQARWKASLLGIGGLAFIGMAITARYFISTGAWPVVGLMCGLFGIACLYHASQAVFGGERLIVTRDGVDLIRRKRSVRLLWVEISRIEVNFDSDGVVSSLDIWTGGREPRLSTSGWTRTPPQIKAEIEAARARWGDD